MLRVAVLLRAVAGLRVVERLAVVRLAVERFGVVALAVVAFGVEVVEVVVVVSAMWWSLRVRFSVSKLELTSCRRSRSNTCL